MIGQLIKSMALFDGSSLYASSLDDLNYEEYISIFSDENAQEMTLTTEEGYIYAKKYDKIIIILNLNKSAPQNKIGSISFLLLRARVISRELNTLYTKRSPELGEILRHKIELGIAAATKDGLRKQDDKAKSMLLESHTQAPVKKEAASAAEAREPPVPEAKKAGSTVEAEKDTPPDDKRPKLEKVLSRFKKREPLIVKVKSREEQKIPEQGKETPDAGSAQRKQDDEAKPKLFDSLALGVYQSAVKKEAAAPAAETREPPVREAKKAETAVEKVPDAEKVEAPKKGEPEVESQLEKEEIQAKKGEADAEKVEDEEDLKELAKEIIRFKRAWAEKKKETDV